MSAAGYDAGLRLRAHATGAPADRTRFAHQLPPTSPVAVEAHLHPVTGTTTITVTDAAGHNYLGDPAQPLSALAAAGVTLTGTHRTLVVASRRALLHLARLAASADDDHAEQAAIVTWWRARADHPGTGAVLDVTGTCAARWALGTAPDADHDLDTWRTWLHPADTTTASTPTARTALALALAITATAGHTLPGLLDRHRQDTASWEHLVNRVQAGWDWRATDSRTEAALGLAARCDAAELHVSLRLRDPLTAHAATHDGHVVQGVVVAVDGTDLTITATRALCRLRTGAPVEGWPGAALQCPPAGRDTTGRYVRAATIAEAAIDAHGHLTLHLSGVVTRGDHLTPGETITLRAKAVDANAQSRSRQNLRQRYAHTANWLNRRTPPITRRRTVPLDVVIAASDDT